MRKNSIRKATINRRVNTELRFKNYESRGSLKNYGTYLIRMDAQSNKWNVEI